MSFRDPRASTDAEDTERRSAIDDALAPYASTKRLDSAAPLNPDALDASFADIGSVTADELRMNHDQHVAQPRRLVFMLASG